MGGAYDDHVTTVNSEMPRIMLLMLSGLTSNLLVADMWTIRSRPK